MAEEAFYCPTMTLVWDCSWRMCPWGFPLFPHYELDATDRCWVGGPTETDTPGHQLAQAVTVQASGFCMAPITLLLDHTT